MRLFVFACLLLAVQPAAAQPKNFVYVGQDELDAALPILERPDISGAQIMYVWRNLEPEKGAYDFSMIEHDLALAKARGKALYVEVLDRFFQPKARHLPQYMLDGPEYGGGLAVQGDTKPVVWSGWVARQWDPAVRARFQALLRALAKQFDGRIAGIILTETAAAIDKEKPPAGWDCERYFRAELDNARIARRVFKRSHVVQYANFWPCQT